VIPWSVPASATIDESPEASPVVAPSAASTLSTSPPEVESPERASIEVPASAGVDVEPPHAPVATPVAMAA